MVDAVKTPAPPEIFPVPPDPVPSLLTVDRAAAYVGVSVRTLREWIYKHRLPVCRLPGQHGARTIHRIRRAALDAWLERYELPKKPVRLPRGQELADIVNSLPG